MTPYTKKLETIIFLLWEIVATCSECNSIKSDMLIFKDRCQFQHLSMYLKGHQVFFIIYKSYQNPFLCDKMIFTYSFSVNAHVRWIERDIHDDSIMNSTVCNRSLLLTHVLSNIHIPISSWYFPFFSKIPNFLRKFQKSKKYLYRLLLRIAMEGYSN